MGIKICILIIIILLIIILFLLRKKVINVLNVVWKSYIFKKTVQIFRKFIYKLVEIFWIIMLGTIILLPLFIYYVLNRILNIAYNEYKELLEIILNSYYVIVIGIIIIVYLFRNEIKKKIKQLKEVNGNGMKFEDTQAKKNFERNFDENDKESEEYDIIQESGEIYEEIREKINEKTEKSKENDKDKLSRLLRENYELENELKNKDKIIKRERFINIKSQIAKTTHIIILYIYNKYTYINLFTKEEISKVLENILNSEKYEVQMDLEKEAIIQFLLNNKIVDTEDDQTFSVTEFGTEFLKFLFEGGY